MNYEFNTPHSEIILDNGRFMRRTTTLEDFGNQDELLLSCMPEQSVYIPNLIKIGQEPVSIIASNTNITAIMGIDKIPFKGEFELADSGQFFEWCLTKQRGSIKVSDFWAVPADHGKLIVAQRFVPSSGSMIPGHCYLWLYLNGELRHFHYPNTYNDGRICMGRDWEATQAQRSRKPITEQMMDMVTSFYATDMNSDLTTDTTCRMFRRNLEGGWLLPGTVEMRNMCPAVSVSFMTGFKG